MEKNRTVFYFVLISLIFLTSLFLVFLFSGCTGNEVLEETVGETSSEDTVKTTAETSIETEAGSTEATSGPETTTDETSNETDKNVITFKGNKVNENTAVMILEVNIETGEVAGVIQMGFKGFDMNMNSTKVCDYVLTGKISGNLDSETLKVIGLLDCNDYNVSYEMFAGMTEDYSRIKGYFDTRTMDDYEFLLKPVTD
jgi:hypothetical protein